MADDTEWTPKQDMSLLCRVCANQHDYLIPIFQGEGLDHDMPTKMDKHLPIKVRESDKLPTQMCYQCASTIIAWSELHTNCLAADKKLKGMLRINEKKMGVVDTADDDAGSDHYEDAYDDGGGGGDDDDEDFEKEIKQLISDAGVELGSKTAKASKRPSRAAATRKRKSEVTITPVKRETKKPKTEPSASKSSTALLKPKEEVVSNEDRFHIWSCCKCCATFMSCEHLCKHVSQHQYENLKLGENVEKENHLNIKTEMDNCFHCLNTVFSHSSQHSGDVFVCHHCDQIFSEKLALEYHMHIDHARITHNISQLTWYACKDCCFLYKREQDIRLHMKRSHEKSNINTTDFIVKSVLDIIFPCEKCHRKCAMAKLCPDHSKWRRTKISIPPERGTFKKEMKVNIGALLLDNCKMHDENHVCQVCELMFDDCENLWSHMFKDHNDEVEFKCNICTSSQDMITFKYVPDIIYHMKMEHKIELFLTNALSEFRERCKICIDGISKLKCVECPAVFLQFRSLKSHILTHSKNLKTVKPPTEKVFHCELCNKRFRRQTNLNQHTFAVHEKQRPHECNICGRGFSEKHNLATHIRTHSGDRKFVCEMCGAAFVQWASLYYHKFSHSEKRLVCSQCGKTFSNPNNLRSHMNLHTGRMIYVCEVCGKEFRSRDTWKGHMAVHSTSRPFSCEHCNASFKLKKHLVQHYKTHLKSKVL